MQGSVQVTKGSFTQSKEDLGLHHRSLAEGGKTNGWRYTHATSTFTVLEHDGHMILIMPVDETSQAQCIAILERFPALEPLSLGSFYMPEDTHRSIISILPELFPQLSKVKTPLPLEL
jgi:hypothetical protein